MIRPGEEWGSPTAAGPDVEVSGDDADLAEAVTGRPGILVRFHPSATSDLAGAVGLAAGAPTHLGIELAVDALQLTDENGHERLAVNMIVIGAPPDASRRFFRRFAANVRVDDRPVFHGPCSTVVVATGQFRRGLDVVPRGHPGDGRAEIQVYAVPGRERAALRARLATGTHVPHPKITQRTAKRVRVSLDRRVPLELDGRPSPGADVLDIEVVPGAYRLLL